MLCIGTMESIRYWLVSNEDLLRTWLQSDLRYTNCLVLSHFVSEVAIPSPLAIILRRPSPSPSCSETYCKLISKELSVIRIRGSATFMLSLDLEHLLETELHLSLTSVWIFSRLSLNSVRVSLTSVWMFSTLRWTISTCLANFPNTFSAKYYSSMIEYLKKQFLFENLPADSPIRKQFDGEHFYLIDNTR